MKYVELGLNRSFLFVGTLFLLGFFLASFAGYEGHLNAGARADIASIERSSNADRPLFTDTAAVPTAFDTINACDQHAIRGLSKASTHGYLGVDRIRNGLFYIASGGTTLVMRCFGMQDGRHYLFLTGSGSNRSAVDATIKLLYNEVAVFDR